LLERTGDVLVLANLRSVPKTAALLQLDAKGDEVWSHVFEEYAGVSLAEVIALSDRQLLLRGGYRVPGSEGAKTVSWIGVAERSGRLIHEMTISAVDSVSLSDLSVIPDGYIAVGEGRDLKTKSRYRIVLRLDKSLNVTARALIRGNTSFVFPAAIAPLGDNKLVIAGERGVEKKGAQGWLAVLAPRSDPARTVDVVDRPN